MKTIDFNLYQRLLGITQVTPTFTHTAEATTVRWRATIDGQSVTLIKTIYRDDRPPQYLADNELIAEEAAFEKLVAQAVQHANARRESNHGVAAV